MSRLTVGEAGLIRIEEIVNMTWGFEEFFPRSDADVLDSHMHWLDPSHTTVKCNFALLTDVQLRSFRFNDIQLRFLGGFHST